MTQQKKIVFGVILAGFSFLALDTAVRVASHVLVKPPYYPFVPDKALGVRHRPNASGIMAPRGTAPHRVSFNALGFRGGQPATVEKAPGTLRVVCLGASTTEDIYVPDGETWPEHLERQLRDRLKTDKVEVINMGVSGYTAQNAVKYFQREGERLKPDVVILYMAINDFVSFLMDRLGPRYRRDLRFVPYYDRPAGRLERMLCKSILLDRANQGLYNARYHRQADKYGRAAVEYAAASRRADVDLSGAGDSILAALNELLAMSRQDGFRLVVARQANLVEPELKPAVAPMMWDLVQWWYEGSYLDWPVYERGYRMVRDAQRQFAIQHGLPYIDAEAAIPKEPGNFVDHVHFSERGTRLMGEVMADALISAGVVSGGTGAAGREAEGR